MWTVYLLRVEGDEQPFYVGCTSRTLHERWLEHKSRLKRAGRWPDDDSILIEEIAAFDSQKIAEEEESRLILHYGRQPEGCLENNNTGGMGGYGVTRDDFRILSSKQISAFDDKGNFIATYPSAREADKLLGVNFGSISNILNKKARTAKNSDGKVFQFRYGDDTSPMEPVLYKGRKLGFKIIRGK